MSMSEVIDWAPLVNKRILDSTTFTVGQDGYEEDKSSSGNFKDRYLSSLFVPDQFQVQMDFSYMEKKDDYGNIIPESSSEWDNALSEYDRFIKWYKFDHKRGINPFMFPSITKFNVNDVDKNRPMCQYRITSAISPQKSGYCMRVSMTWEEVFSGIIEITETESVLEDLQCKISGTTGKAMAWYSAILDSKHCVVNNCTLKYKESTATDWTDAPILNCVKQGKNAYLYFTAPTDKGYYSLQFNDGTTTKYETFTVA